MRPFIFLRQPKNTMGTYAAIAFPGEVISTITLFTGSNRSPAVMVTLHTALPVSVNPVTSPCAT